MNRDYWENRYRTSDMPWEKGAPSPGLVDFLEQHRDLPKGTVCVPGCGTGHDARAWARAGYTVTGIDIAPSAIQQARQRTRREGLEAEFLTGDFLSERPPSQFDWVFEHTLFCAIQPHMREPYARALPRWLKPDGNFLAVFYLIPDRDGPPFGTTRDELIQRFSPDYELCQEWVPRSYPNRTGLELMMWWRGRGGGPGANHRAEPYV